MAAMLPAAASGGISHPLDSRKPPRPPKAATRPRASRFTTSGAASRKSSDFRFPARQVRDVPGLKKKPSTSELLDWLKLLLHEDMPLDVLQNRDPTKAIPPLHGALLKNEQDVMLFERLAFMAKRQANKG